MNAIKQDREKVLTAACIDDDTIDTVMLQVKRHLRLRQSAAKKLLNSDVEEEKKECRELISHINSQIKILLGI